MMRQSTILFLLLLCMAPSIGQAQTICTSNDLPCLFSTIEQESENIKEPRWKNQAYRDLAVSKAMAGDYDGATALIAKIDNADTQAMTVRAIGMAVAIHQDLSVDIYRLIFSKLDKASQGIKDPGAKDIAYTYIAMAQAFAKLDEDATITTTQMSNPALKYKAYAETSEIQIGRGALTEALKSINAIDSDAFKNKALATGSGLLVKDKDFDNALKLAMMINNPTTKISAIQKIIDTKQGLNEKSGGL